jgi:hypothetical protein
MNALHAESLDWIRMHPDATNTDVPPHLLDAWLHGDLGAKDADFSLFATGCLLWIARRGESGRSFKFDVGGIAELYGLWQWKLAMAKISRATRVKVDPMPLFAIDPGSSITTARLARE